MLYSIFLQDPQSCHLTKIICRVHCNRSVCSTCIYTWHVYTNKIRLHIKCFLIYLYTIWSTHNLDQSTLWEVIINCQKAKSVSYAHMAYTICEHYPEPLNPWRQNMLRSSTQYTNKTTLIQDLPYNSNWPFKLKCLMQCQLFATYNKCK